MKNFAYTDSDFPGFLKELLDSGMLDSSDATDRMCIGISELAIDKGWSFLSTKQQNVIRVMVEKLCYAHCAHCLDSIPWCEMLYAIEHDGMCSHCVKIWNDIEKE